MTIWEIYPLVEVFDLYTQSLPNLYVGVMHNCDIVRWEKKNSPYMDMRVEMYGLQTEKATCGYIYT